MKFDDGSSITMLVECYARLGRRGEKREFFLFKKKQLITIIALM